MTLPKDVTYTMHLDVNDSGGNVGCSDDRCGAENAAMIFWKKIYQKD